MSETHPYARRWQALIVLATSLLVVSVGNTILNLALPTIRDELDASSSELQWIVDGYMLVFAGLLLVAGQPRRPLRAPPGAVRRPGRCSGSARSSPPSSGSATELIASRALMGVGAAAIMPVTLSVITNIFPDGRAAQGDRALGRRRRDSASRSGRSPAAG